MTLGQNSSGKKELLLMQKLSDVEPKVRSKAFKQLKKYLLFKSSKEGFTYDDLIKIWKGIYYCMYMADKPLAQEELAENIACLIHDIQNKSQKLIFFKASLETFSREWNGIDNFRMDKFMMLFTRILRQCFVNLNKTDWELEEVISYSRLFETIILCPSDNNNAKPLGLKMHLTDIILEELAKVGKEELRNEVIISFLYPFFKVLLIAKQYNFVKYVQSRVFRALIRQSDLGIEHQDDLTIGELEIVKPVTDDEDKDDEDTEVEGVEEHLDPRAGGVDVYIPQLKPDYVQIANIFMALGSIPELSQKKRNIMYAHCNEFLDLEKGTYPFKDPVIDLNEEVDISGKKLIKQGVKRLREFEEDLKSDCDGSTLKRQKMLHENSNKLGDVCFYPNNKRKLWKPLRKKSKAERAKEISKGKVDLERAMELTLIKMAGKLEIPKCIYVSDLSTSRSKKNKAKKKRKAKIRTSAEVTSIASESLSAPKEKVENQWNEPLKDGETEIFIPSRKFQQKQKKYVAGTKQKQKKYVAGTKQKQKKYVAGTKQKEKKYVAGTMKMVIKKTARKNSKGKILKINLRENKEHTLKEYKNIVNARPGIPYSTIKNPKESALKTPFPVVVHKPLMKILQAKGFGS